MDGRCARPWVLAGWHCPLRRSWAFRPGRSPIVGSGDAGPTAAGRIAGMADNPTVLVIREADRRGLNVSNGTRRCGWRRRGGPQAVTATAIMARPIRRVGRPIASMA